MIRVQNPLLQNPVLEGGLRLPRDRQNQAIQKIAWEILFEWIATGAVACIACAFAATPAAVSFIVTAAALQLIVNLALRLINLAVQNFQVENAVSWATSFNFGWGTGLYKQTLIHEAGHALAAHAVYKNARAKITLLPYFGGNTRFFSKHLSAFGRQLGPDKAIAFVTVAGPGLTLLVSALELSAALLTSEKYPKLSRCLILMAGFDFFIHTLYALSALATPKTLVAHDFVRLSLYGLHPVAAAVGIAAIPFVIAGGAYLIKQCARAEG